MRPPRAKSRWEAWTTGRAGAGLEVVAVEGDVDVAERDLAVEQLVDQALRRPASTAPRRWMPDQGDLALGVLLDDLVRDAHERAAHVVAVEDDLWDAATRSFLASRDRVKGTDGPDGSKER